MPEPPVSGTILGIDAGGSKTRVAFGARAELCKSSLSEAVLGPGNYRQVGASGVRALVREITAHYQLTDPSDTLVVGGFAGAGTAESQEAIRGILEDEGYAADNVRTITSDGGLLLWALGDDGIALIAGTGSICIGRRRGSPGTEDVEARAGGYGYRLPSDVGGYRLGLGAIEAALRIEDGRPHEPTTLHQRVKEHFGLEDLQRIIPHLYPAGEVDGEEGIDVREKVAALSGAVFAAAAGGDGVAAGLVTATVDELADLVQAVFHKLGSRPAAVALHGGLFADPHAGDLLLVPLCQHAALSPLPLRFETLGVRPDDKDPLIEAMRSILRTGAQ